MRVRLGRGALAAVLVGTLVIPTVASTAGPKQRLQEAQDRLEDIREDIASKASKAGTLREKVDVLNESLTKLQLEVARLNGDIAEIESEVRDAQDRIDQTQKEISAIEEKATEQAISLYKGGDQNVLSVLLSSKSLSELDEKVEMLGIAAQENTGALIRYGRLQVEIRAQSRELFDKKDELAAVLDSRTAVLEEQSKRKAELSSELGALRESLGIKKSRESHLENEIASTKDLLIEHQAKSAVAALGTSDQGFIWPLNGGVTSYYGPRWGRMHTGIDIDGVSGQPIVAAKEGQVVLAAPYSGYGNAVILDHGGGYGTLYAHMSSFNTSGGAYVEQGDIVGYVGCTGSCTGDHLHFEVRVNGNPTDPMIYLP